VEPVADSGLWQHLATDVLPLVDAARLVGTVSDNWATNALLDVVGIDAVRERARLLAPGGSVLHDLVRDHRGPGHPPTLSEGCASDWVAIVPALDERVRGWLSSGVDLSMVASAWGLDPLAHREDPDVRLVNKTGTSDGVRADVGVVEHRGRRTAYAALAAWDPARPGLRGPVLAAMRGIGGLVALG
jgi:beta-lactamase class A